MNLIKPENLKPGDTVAIVAPSGALDREKFLQGIKFFETLGLKTVFSERIFERKRYLAGEDDGKVEELEEYFKNPEINGIICARGGYGAIRLINRIDYDVVRNHPKYFGGYSDITALQLMFLKKSGLVSYTSPMIQSDFGQDEVSSFTVENFLNPANIIECKVLKSGEAQGILWGGNLSIVVSLCGTDFLPEEDFIFFVEDIAEPVYKIDKMLQQLMNTERFCNNLKGLIFGEFSRVDRADFLEELKFEIAEKSNIPIVENLNITHSKDKLTLPVGGFAKILGNKLFL